MVFSRRPLCALLTKDRQQLINSPQKARQQRLACNLALVIEGTATASVLQPLLKETLSTESPARGNDQEVPQESNKPQTQLATKPTGRKHKSRAQSDLSKRAALQPMHSVPGTKKQPEATANTSRQKRQTLATNQLASDVGLVTNPT